MPKLAPTYAITMRRILIFNILIFSAACLCGYIYRSMPKIIITIQIDEDDLAEAKEGREGTYSLSQFIDCYCNFNEDDVTVEFKE